MKQLVPLAGSRRYHLLNQLLVFVEVREFVADNSQQPSDIALRKPLEHVLRHCLSVKKSVER